MSKKNQLHRTAIVIAFLISLVYFGIFLAPDFVTDSYAVDSQDSVPGRTMIGNGRVFSAVYEVLTFRVLHLSFAWATRVSAIFAIFNVGMAILICYRLYRYLASAHDVNRHESKVVLFLLAVMTVINPMTTELFSFFEKAFMTLSVLAAALGAERFVRAIDGGDKNDYLYSILLGIVSVMCYQGTYGTYLVLMLFSIAALASHKQPARIIKEIVCSLFAYGVALIVDVAIVKLSTIILGTVSRGASGINPIGTLAVIRNWSEAIAKFFYVVPAWLLPVFSLCLLTGAIIHSALHHNGKVLVKFVVGSIAIWVLSYSIAVWLTLGEDYRYIWFAPRIVYPLGMVFGLIGLWYYLLYSKYAKGGLLELLMIAVMAIELVKFNSLFVGRYKANAIDRYRAEWLTNQIYTYESKSGHTIKKINFYDDAAPTKVDSGVTDRFEMNFSAFSKEWSDVHAVSIYSGRYFKRGKSNDNKMSRYCRSHDWSTLDSEQVKFSGETMNVCNY